MAPSWRPSKTRGLPCVLLSLEHREIITLADRVVMLSGVQGFLRRAVRVYNAPGPAPTVIQPTNGLNLGASPGLEQRPTGHRVWVCALLGAQLALLRKLLELLHEAAGGLLVLLAQLLPDRIVG